MKVKAQPVYGRNDSIKEIVLRAKTRIKAIIGLDIAVKPTFICPKERFGSIYGGWDIATSDINPDSIIYSFGVGEDITFEKALTHRFGLTVHAFDPTPRSIEWIRQQNLGDQFIMHEYGLAGFDGEASFNPPANPDYVSYTILDRPTAQNAVTAPVKKLSTIMKELGHNKIDVLKMDIEGAEYQVIDDIIESNIRPLQILVEFHHRFPGVSVNQTETSIAGLRAMGYLLFSVSASNQELCFIHKSK